MILTFPHAVPVVSPHDQTIRHETPTQFARRFVRPQFTAGPCIEWTGPIQGNGYGQVGRHGLAHRVSHELVFGPIPAGLQIDHLCRNRKCVNPMHLEPVTARENQMRSDGPAGVNARRTHCVHGHPLEGKNLRVNRRGSRVCNLCSNARNRADYWKRKARMGA